MSADDQLGEWRLKNLETNFSKLEEYVSQKATRAELQELARDVKLLTRTVTLFVGAVIFANFILPWLMPLMLRGIGQ
jgi:hypothetical protein